jgi:signal peptidase I
MKEEDIREIDDIDTEDLDTEDLEASAEKESSEAKKRRILKEILCNSLYLLAVFLTTLFLVKYVGQRTVVLGSSMETTLSDQDNLIVDKISYRLSDPKRFDIIVFPFSQADETYYIKRIIGLPGETVRIDYEGNIYINEKILDENYGTEVIIDPGTAAEEITLGPDQYFVLGDNRNHSSDSRSAQVGLIERSRIIGRAWIRIFPFDKFGSIDKDE